MLIDKYKDNTTKDGRAIGLPVEFCKEEANKCVINAFYGLLVSGWAIPSSDPSNDREMLENDEFKQF